MNRRAAILVMAGLAGVLGIGMAAGCNARMRHWLLEGPGTQPPPLRRVRRDLPAEIEKLERQLARLRGGETGSGRAGMGSAGPPITEAGSWAEVSKLLPTTAAGSPDWVRALDDRIISPRPGVDPEERRQPVLDLEYTLSSSSGRMFSVAFSHAPHTEWLACWNCHPGIFPLSKTENPLVLSMDKINAGRYCGVCHGPVSFGAEKGCSRCHRGIPEHSAWEREETVRPPAEQTREWAETLKRLPLDETGNVDWVRALDSEVIRPRRGLSPEAEGEEVLELDVDMIPVEDPEMKVVFPHRAHTEWLSCENCHPRLYEMKQGTRAATMEDMSRGESCGLCHGTVAFSLEACGRCHQALGPQER